MSSRQNTNGNDAPEKSQRALQALKVTITPTRNLQSNTAPTTPTRPTPKGLSTSAIGVSGSVTSNKPSKAQRANNDHGVDLSPWQIPTDPDDMEEEDAQSETPEETKSDIQRKTSTRSFSNLTTNMKASYKRSQSAKKVSKSPVPAKSPKASAQGSRRIGTTDDDDKNSQRFKEKPRRSLQPMYQSVDGHDSPKQKKKLMKTAVGDLEFDLGIEEKCVTEGEERDNLFEDKSASKEVHLKELGPVRYSKMSEEDAATVFEMRKRELLNFLIKLGANPNLVKKKFASKNIGGKNQLNNSVELRSSGFDRDRVMRTLKGTLEDNLSPNRFIVYNTDRDPIWNNQRGRFATPNRQKNRAASTKPQGKSEPSFKRRNSAKILRDREDENVIVKRDLTASFNNVVFDNELSDGKSPIKIRKARDPQLRNSHQIVLDPHDVSDTKSPMKAKKSADTTTAHRAQDEKKEVIESFTIDLVKFCSDEKKKKKKKKGKKAKKSKADEEQISQIERASQSDTNKLPSENISINTVYESNEDTAAYQKLIETMRQKSKLVMGDINEIDLQIQMMQDDGKKGKNQKRGRDQNTIKTAEKPKAVINLEKPKAIFLESLEEGYSNAAKMKHAQRSGSFSINIDPYEATPKTVGGNKKIMIQRENETERLRAGQDTSRTTLSRNNKTEIITDSKPKKGATTRASPTFELDRKGKAVVETESKKKSLQDVSDKRVMKNEAPKTPKQSASPTFFGKKETPEITKSKMLSPNNSRPTLDKKSNLIQPQPISETPKNLQQDDRNKLLNAFRNSSSTQSQATPIRFNEETLKKSTAALQSNKETSSSNFRSNPRPQLLTNEKKMLSSPSSQIPSTATSNNRSPLMPKTGSKKVLMMNKSQLSIDNNSSSDINESTDLFDKCQTTKSHKVTKSATKSTFSEGVKKILREGSKEDNSLLLGPKPSKNQNKTSQATAKPMESNRPKFEIPTAEDIRTKMYKEGRMNHPDGTFVKVNYVSNGALEPNKPQVKGVVIEEIHNAAKSGKDGKANRKRSLSPRPDSANTTDRKNNSQINSLQDITEKKNRGAGADTEHAERMKLLGQTIKSKREVSTGNQNQNKPYRQ